MTDEKSDLKMFQNHMHVISCRAKIGLYEFKGMGLFISVFNELKQLNSPGGKTP